MKIINISFFLKSFVNKKNANKLLFFINIGIFLSLFAITSALITFYTEKKISNIEFELIKQHNDNKFYNDTLDEFSQVRNVLYTWQKHEKDITSLLERHGIKQINPLNEKFDPLFHEALFEAPSDKHEQGFVTQVVELGYVLEKRLIRPAKVGVSSKK